MAELDSGLVSMVLGLAYVLAQLDDYSSVAETLCKLSSNVASTQL